MIDVIRKNNYDVLNCFLFCNMKELMNLSVFSVTCSAFTMVPTYRWSQTPHFTIKKVCECVCMLVCHPSILQMFSFYKHR